MDIPLRGVRVRPFLLISKYLNFICDFIGLKVALRFGGFAEHLVASFNYIRRVDDFLSGWRACKELGHLLPIASR